MFSDEPPFTRLAFTLDEPNLDVRDGLRFADRNPDHLGIEIGKQSAKGLVQSWLAARTNNAHALTIWKEVAKRLKKVTKAGVTVINPDSGAAVASRSFRYSDGAKALESSGVEMLPFAGGCRIKLQLPVAPSK